MKMNSSVRVLLTALVFTASAVDLHSVVVADLRAVAVDAAGDANPASGAIPGRRPMMRRDRLDRATASASGIYPNDPLSEGYANAVERGSEPEARQEQKQGLLWMAVGSRQSAVDNETAEARQEPNQTIDNETATQRKLADQARKDAEKLAEQAREDTARAQEAEIQANATRDRARQAEILANATKTQLDSLTAETQQTLKEAREAEQLADIEATIAKQERNRADEAKREAEQLAEEAREAKEEARNQTKKADWARRQAWRQRKRGDQETKRADEESVIAKRAAQRAAKEAIKAEAAAQESEAAKERLKVEKACAAYLTRQVRTEMYCAANGTLYTVKAPGGVMLLGTPVQAYRCTNSGACLNERQWVGIRSGAACHDPSNCCQLGPVPQSPAVMCRIGYDPNSPGCSRCDQGYGRAGGDPFVCEECGNPGLQWAVFGIMPAILFVVSFRGATAYIAGGIFNDLMKIFLSFGSGSSVVMSAVVASKSYPELPVGLQDFLGIGDKSTKAGSAVYSASLDCIMGSTATIGDMLLLSLAAPLAIFLMSCTFLAVRNVLSFSSRPLRLDIVSMSLVLGNQFLPTIVGASVRALPCIHMQKYGEGAVRNHVLAYDVDVECEDRPSYQIMVMVGACTFAFFSGPYYWWWLLSKRQPDTQAIAQPRPAESSNGGDLDAGEATAAGEETVTGGPVEETPAQEVPSQIGPDEENKCGEAGEGGGGSAASEMPVDGAAADNAAMPEINACDVAFAVEKEGGPVISETAWESTLGFLTRNYRPEIRNWESWVLLRKIALSVVSTLAPMSYSAGAHIIQALIILLVSLVAHFFAWPYKAEKNLLNIVEGVSLTVLNLALVLAVYVSIDIWSSTAFSRQVATVAAGTLLVANFYTLIGFMIWAFWKDFQKASENREETT